MRSEQMAKNVASGFLNQFLIIILGFISRTVFISSLQAGYLGISGLFTSVLTVLNISELGIETAITYALFLPLAENNEEKVAATMRFYRNAYRGIGLFVLVFGIALIPLLPWLISPEASSLVNIYVVYFLYLIESLSSYWIGAYKSTLLEANQQKYIVTLYTSVETIVVFSLKIVSLLVLKDLPKVSFYVYLGIGILGRIILNLFLARRVNIDYPYLKGKNVPRLGREEIASISKNVAGLFVSKLSGVMLTAADNILISAFISTTVVGLYSNYIALKSYVVKPIGIVFDSMTAGVGNFCATESLKKQEQFFSTLQFTYFWIYGFCSICFWILFNPFIAGVWIGEKYLLSNLCVFLITLNFVLDGFMGAVITFRTVYGLHWETKYRYFFSALFNVIISYLLIKPLGVEGVLLGSTASILIMISFDPILVFKKVFNKRPFRYYMSYVGYLLLTLSTGLLVTLIVSPFSQYTVKNFFIKLIVCCSVPNMLWYIMFRNSPKMSQLKKYVFSIVSQLRSIILGGLKRDM